MAKNIFLKNQNENRSAFGCRSGNLCHRGDGNPVEEVIKDFVDGKVGRYVIAEKSMDKEEMVPVHEMDSAYFADLVKGVHARKEDIEKSLSSYLAKGWTLERMDETLRALLLCAIYEITTTLDIDAKVIIKEYVDLAYAFLPSRNRKWSMLCWIRWHMPCAMTSIRMQRQKTPPCS